MPVGHRVKSTDVRFDTKLGTIPEKSAVKHISTGHNNLNMPNSSAVEEKLKPEGREGDGLANVAALTSMAIFVGYTFYLILASNPKSLSWFAFHPPLQVLAIGIFVQGILTLQPTSQPKTKAAGLTRHQLYMLITAFPIITVGTWVIIHNKNINQREHFTSWHGKIGIISILWMVGQILIGAGSVWFRGAAFGGGMKAKSLWKYHRASGYILLPLFLYAAHLGGAWSTFSNSHASHIMRILTYTVAPLVALIAVYSRVRPSKMRFF